jgi:hypothetical protein
MVSALSLSLERRGRKGEGDIKKLAPPKLK